MMLVGAGSVPMCCQGNETSEGWCAGAVSQLRRGAWRKAIATAIIAVASIKCPSTAVAGGVPYINTGLCTCTYCQLQTQGALAAAVALSCSVIVMAAPGSVNETPRISSARSTPHYRKSKLPHPRPAAARAVCTQAC
jgi:hypothetical protein